MVIKRNGNDFGLPAEVIEIGLTPQELEQAYKIKEKEYRRQNKCSAMLMGTGRLTQEFMKLLKIIVVSMRDC